MNKILSLKNLNFPKPRNHFSNFKQIISRQKGKIIFDLNRIQQPQSHIQSVVIVNNQLNIEWLQKGIRSCQNIILADGGANKFYNTPFKDNAKVRSIVGDFDSLHNHVRNYYQQRGVEFQKIWNQDTNDFEKAIKKSIRKGWNKIFCFGAFGGRMDHTLGSMHHANKLCKQHQDLDIILFGRTNLMYFLRPNVLNVIRISNKIQKTGCGLIPFGVAEKVKTKGFRWNLGPQEAHQSLEWGNFISTSNQIYQETIKVETSHPIFFVAHFL